ncbi:MAG: response regulator transcription factor [Oscillospiraceae bacterium]|nr:response regulator transcription factor [Oscillospiraceae bacterium]MBQ8884320.1 response regulator transcription factor [Oscillospiraceae bacterium]
MENHKVLLVDDEPLLLESLEIILTFGGMEIVGTAHNGNEALSVLENTTCDIALVDINMPEMGGIELISHLKKDYPSVKILVLTTFYDDETITKAISGGADGYLLKDSGKDAILGAVSQIMSGRNVIDAKVMQRLAALMSGQKSEPDILKEMTAREKEIATLLAQGLSNKQIAEKLYISEGTVKNYISVIYDKTGIHDRAKLIVAINS